jgi:hypothetical protein
MNNRLRNSAGQAEASPNSNGQANGRHGNPSFFMMPDEIAARRDLSWRAKALFGSIYSFTRMKLGRCIASNEEFKRRLGVTDCQLRRAFEELDKAGLIERDVAHGRRQEIRTTWEPGMRDISNHRRAQAPARVAPAPARVAPAPTEKTLEKTLEKTTTDQSAKSSSSFFAALPIESGGTGGGRHPRRSGPPRDEEPEAAAIDPRRLADAVAAVLALGLRRNEDDAAPLDAAQAKTLILGAARKWSGGLFWVAWAIHRASKRRNPAKGRKAVQSWGWIVGTLRNWERDNSGPAESDGWPGEQTAAPRRVVDSVCNARG